MVAVNEETTNVEEPLEVVEEPTPEAAKPKRKRAKYVNQDANKQVAAAAGGFVAPEPGPEPEFFNPQLDKLEADLSGMSPHQRRVAVTQALQNYKYPQSPEHRFILGQADKWNIGFKA